MEESAPRFRDQVLSNVCQFDFLLYVAFIFEIVLLLFAIVAFLYGDLDTATQTILYIDFVLLGIAIAATVGLIHACNRTVG